MYPSTTPFVTDGGPHEKPSVWNEITLMVKFCGGPGAKQQGVKDNILIQLHAMFSILVM